MKQEQSSLEKGVTLKELLFCYNTIQNKKGGVTTQEEYDMWIKTEKETKWILLDNHKKAIADQKQKYEERINKILEQVIKDLESLRSCKL